MRKTLMDTTLSDGTFIPSGTLIAGASTATHRDSRNFDHPDSFDPSRFVEMRNDGLADAKHQFVSISPEYIPFGLGKHAWYVRTLNCLNLAQKTVFVLTAQVVSSPLSN